MFLAYVQMESVPPMPIARPQCVVLRVHASMALPMSVVRRNAPTARRVLYGVQVRTVMMEWDLAADIMIQIRVIGLTKLLTPIRRHAWP